MYTRIKKIKGIEYAYLVKSYWSKRKKTPKQKTVKYLGKVYKLKKTKNISLEKYIKIKNIEDYYNKTPYKKIIQDLIKLELYNHNFKKIRKNILVLNNIVINFENKKIYDKLNNKQICIEINNNFLSTKTLRNIINLIIPPGLIDSQIYKHIANSFISAGINIPQDKFVILSQKILNKIKK